MLKKICLSLILTLIIGTNALANGVGTWKTYLAYSNPTWVEQAGSKYYVLSSNALYIYNKNDHSIQTLDRTNGLNDTDIQYIGWNNIAKALVIVYANNNIDLLDGKGNVTSIADYANKMITGDKTIHGIDMSEEYCYVSTGFGILKINIAKKEIKDSYNLGFSIHYTYVKDNYIYAASPSNGLYRGLMSDNLLDKSKWKRVGEYTDKIKTPDPTVMEEIKKLNPGGPKENHFAYMTFLNNRLYTAAGLFISGQNDLNLEGTIQVMKDNIWQIYESGIEKKTGYEYVDQNVLAVDPRDPDHVFAAGRTGLYEFQGGQLKAYYNKDNSLLRGAIDRGTTLGNNYILINGLAFDKKGSLWVLNSQSDKVNILELKADNTWSSHFHSELVKDGVSMEAMISPIFDQAGNLWFGNKAWRNPALVCYNPTTDNIAVYNKFTNQDGSLIKIQNVNCVALDFLGNIWIGTDLGLLELEKGQMGNPLSATFTQIKVPRNDGSHQADYLLSGININAIAIDQAGRKWIGTESNGAYLIGEDNITQIHHFLSSNSKLLSDNIQSITIDHKTGEVFFGTDKGLCSYMSDATSTVEKMDKETTYAYPNPVKPGYRGPITIVGLAYNTDIKIVSTSGVLVAEGTSNGGTFVWDGNDRNGKRVASGVYMVETANQNGQNGTVCKVAIVN